MSSRLYQSSSSVLHFLQFRSSFFGSSLSSSNMEEMINNGWFDSVEHFIFDGEHEGEQSHVLQAQHDHVIRQESIISSSTSADGLTDRSLFCGSYRNESVQRKKNKERRSSRRVAFITKSEVEKLDDGYKWRKYGKKRVKDSPNPRNYYRCSSEGCNVKKRVERMREDSSYVMTTYEGIHNHFAPFEAAHLPSSSTIASLQEIT